MEQVKRELLGALLEPAYTMAKKHGVSVDAMMQAVCGRDVGKQADKAAKAFAKAHPSAKKLKWPAPSSGDPEKAAAPAPPKRDTKDAEKRLKAKQKQHAAEMKKIAAEKAAKEKALAEGEKASKERRERIAKQHALNEERAAAEAAETKARRAKAKKIKPTAPMTTPGVRAKPKITRANG